MPWLSNEGSRSLLAVDWQWQLHSESELTLASLGFWDCFLDLFDFVDLFEP